MSLAVALAMLDQLGAMRASGGGADSISILAGDVADIEQELSEKERAVFAENTWRAWPRLVVSFDSDQNGRASCEVMPTFPVRLAGIGLSHVDGTSLSSEEIDAVSVDIVIGVEVNARGLPLRGALMSGAMFRSVAFPGMPIRVTAEGMPRAQVFSISLRLIGRGDF